MSRIPIRLRLTAWYVLVLAVVLAAVGLFVVTRLRSDLTAEVDRSLRSASVQIAAGYRHEGTPEFREVAMSVLEGPRDRGTGAQIVDATGTVVASVGDAALATAFLDRDTMAAASSGRRSLDSRHLAGSGDHVRTLASPVRRRGEAQVVVVTESLAEVDRSVRRVLVLMLVGGAGALVLVAAGGWWIARKALLPVERMTARADEIGIDDLTQRVTVPPTRDEVGHLARTLNAMLARLERGVQARQRLVADAAHELRAPLTALRSELEVSLRQDPLDDAARAVVESAHAEVLRMTRIVENLLTLARVDEGRLELLTAPEDLAAIVERSVRAQRSVAAGANVELAVEGEQATVQADGDRIAQVVTNLVDNAIRFSPQGGSVRVAVWSDTTDSGVSVSDEGPGIPEEARERIFERFAREDPARGRGGGAGLGLAICREIVHAHGGRIWVEAGEPRGSRFVVALPRP